MEGKLMAGFFSQVKELIGGTFGLADKEESAEYTDDYVEVNPEKARAGDNKVVVRPFVMEDFEDIKHILESLRDGKTIALINIQPLKDKDLVELKRAINKIKKTCEAIEGDVAGFGDDWICATPAFAHIHRSTVTADLKAAQPEEKD
ncbi:cell division protein SepF [Candidatus Woesearchaeota archaeon]|nr:cell division protein SepF [Candidatus Woesearchaeota archaeon]